MNDEPVVNVDSRDMWILGIAFSMMLATVALLVVCVILISGNQQTLIREAGQAAATRHGVCEYRDNLIQQVKDQEHYLAVHPDGAPALGISASSIRATIARQRAAVDSLVGLDCGTP